MTRRIRIILLMIAAVLPSTAQLRLPAIMSDHMVMQRNEKIRFWG